ncbi:(d)CMP kinase [Hazenella sp. IB182357]|uniref:Cytidylate kinase n=1 Tax=Polycladospora coralii TaxID=2771432 RepID=A0A926N5C5_9BACL|nr:(d)CMP kinase [Polycladospora coralii]MBD1371644.1 (d)CMP kinase [Polycladospora coralii]MBS7529111.1 (d)CMP kinase [Polycladospora coralii]
MKKFQVAIDGPAGAGKSTVARRLADKLGAVYVDTGAMYRAIAWRVLQDGIELMNEKKISSLAEALTITLDTDGVYVDGLKLTDEIRSNQVSLLASDIAKIAGVRKALVKKQQLISQSQAVVMDGRDIGTHVLPHADVKIFLTASIEARAQRRYQELRAKGESTQLEVIHKEIADRDENDRKRTFAPLRQAEDALFVETTSLTIEEVTEMIFQLCRNKLGGEE